MRTRNEIEESEVGRMGSTRIMTDPSQLILEVLLDIRDLLTKKDTDPIGTAKRAIACGDVVYQSDLVLCESKSK